MDLCPADPSWSKTVMVPYDIFKHLYDFPAACRTQVLDFRTRVLINRRTGVRSYARTKGEKVMVSTTAHRPPLRLTRRGRVVVLTFFITMASLASAVLFTTASRADNPPAGPAPRVVVQPHDTLWSIATRVSAGRDPFAAIAEIQRLNGLDSTIVRPGQTLILPREG